MTFCLAIFSQAHAIYCIIGTLTSIFAHSNSFNYTPGNPTDFDVDKGNFDAQNPKFYLYRNQLITSTNIKSCIVGFSWFVCSKH